MTLEITKYIHSCLLVESSKQTVLFDPGSFTYEAGIFSTQRLPRLDNIIVTHEHSDHMHAPFLKELTLKFPDAAITTTPNAAKRLIELGFKNIKTSSHSQIELFEAPHEPNEPLGQTPQNTGAHILSILTNPGDSHHFAESKEILALPITAPWGALTKAAEAALNLKPKYIIPIHDWHLSERAKIMTYERLKVFFTENNIEFIKPVDGRTFEIELS